MRDYKKEYLCVTKPKGDCIMEKIIYQKPKRPIGQKHHPLKPTDYEPSDDFMVVLKRYGIRSPE